MVNTVQSILRGTLLTVKNPVIAAGGPNTITEEVKRLLEDAQSDLKPEHITSIRIGKVIGALRLERVNREKRGEARKWKVTRDDLLTYFVTYSLSLPEGIFPKNFDTITPGAPGADQDIPIPASDPAPGDMKNAGGLSTPGAPGDLVQVHSNGSAAPPCAVCGGAERWNDGGIWRCVACYPPRTKVGSL